MKVLRAVAVAAALLAGVSASQAAFQIKFESAASSTPTINMMALGSNSGPGWSYSGYTDTSGGITEASFTSLNVYGYRINMVTARTNSPHGDPGQLKLLSLSIRRFMYYNTDGTVSDTSGAFLSNSSLKIAFSADGYLRPSADRYMKTIFSGAFDATATTGDATFKSIYDPGDTLFGGGSGEKTAIASTTYKDPFSGIIYTTLDPGAGAYSLTNEMNFTNFGVGLNNVFSGGGIDTIILPVPAPPAIVLAALGIPALGLVRRWTRNTPADAVVA